MKLMFVILISLLHSNISATELERLDSIGSVALEKVDKQTFVYMTKDCSICHKQLKVLKKCLPKDKISVLIDGANEQELRKYVFRKKFKVKTYFLFPGLKQKFKIGNESPQILFYNKEIKKKLVGLHTCNQVKKYQSL